MSTDEPGQPSGDRREGLLRRTIRKRWIPLLTQWGILSTALAISAYFALAPRYTASAWLKVDGSPGLSLNGPKGSNLPATAPDPETEAALLTSPEVIQMAVRDPRVSALGWVAKSPDPEAVVRRHLSASLRPRTRIIVVEITSERPQEAATIVNAVVDAYFRISTDSASQELRYQMDRLKEMEKWSEREQADQRERLRLLLERSIAARGGGDNRRSISKEEDRRFREELAKIEVERIRADSELNVLRRRAREKPGAVGSRERIEELETRVESLAGAEQGIKKNLSYLEIDAKDELAEELEARFARADLEHTEATRESIRRRLDELQFEARDGHEVRLLSRASGTTVAPSTGRLAAMAAIPVLVMAGLLGMFTRIEAWSSRRASRAAGPANEGPDPSGG